MRRWARYNWARLAPTSIAAAAAAGQPTSVSARGATIPLWRHGRRIELPVQRRDRRACGGGKNGIGNMEHGVVLTGRSFSVDPGAVIDVSGGARWPARHSSADEAVPRIPCTTRCPGSTRHRANSNCRRWTPARSMPSCQGCPTGMRRWRRGCLRRLRGSRPLPGETITIGAGVPGLAAGTYTLLPAYYALLPGAFRVEVGANAQPFAPVGLRGGS